MDGPTDGRTEGDGPGTDPRATQNATQSDSLLSLKPGGKPVTRSLPLSDTICGRDRSARQQPQPIFSAHNLWSGNEHLADDPVSE